MSQAFRPVFEVDAFRWPAITDDLLQNHARLLVPVAEQLLAATEEGRSLVGIAGIRPGVGASTVHLCLARLVASIGKSVAIVDGDFASRSLAHNLGLECDAGWETVLAGEAPLAECVVRSIDDGVALLPLVGHSTPPVELLTSIQTSVSAGVLRYHYDLVLFDLGAACREPQASAARTLVDHCRIDASIIVADWANDHAAGAEQVDQLLSLFGSTCLGLIGNQSLR
jgi:Mrp family chromosome partitioning ATPase